MNLDKYSGIYSIEKSRKYRRNITLEFHATINHSSGGQQRKGQSHSITDYTTDLIYLPENGQLFYESNANII